MSGSRRTLVTGGAGFVGSCLVRRLLRDGHVVEVVVRPGGEHWRLADLRPSVRLHEVDLRDNGAVEAAVDAAGADWIFHLAAHGAYSWQSNPRDIIETNTLGTLNLTEACIRRGFEAFVHAGSSSEYGFKDHAPSELEAPEPNSAYAVAKVAATLLCRQLAQEHELHMTTLRLYSVYGPWEDPRRLIPTLLANGLRDALPRLVDPETSRDFIHVEDVCEAFVLVASAPGSTSDGIYNVGSGTQTRLRELVETARSILNISAPAKWGTHEPRRWDTSSWVADPTKIERELGWQSRLGLEAGLSGFADWLLENPAVRERYGVSASLS